MAKEESAPPQITVARITAIAGITVAIITTFGGALIGYLSGASNANDELITEIKNIREENKALIEQQDNLLSAIDSATAKIIEESKPDTVSDANSASDTAVTRSEELSSDAERQQAVSAIPIISRTGAESRLRELQKLLAEAKFKEANQKTAQVMNWIRQQGDGWISTKDASNFECVDLQTIDRLWKAASYEKFGLSIQKNIWQLDRSLESFGDQVGWRISGSGVQPTWKKYSELTFDLRAPQGHLPARNIDPEYGEAGLMNEGWLVWAFRDSACLD